MIKYLLLLFLLASCGASERPLPPTKKISNELIFVANGTKVESTYVKSSLVNQIILAEDLGIKASFKPDSFVSDVAISLELSKIEINNSSLMLVGRGAAIQIDSMELKDKNIYVPATISFLKAYYSEIKDPKKLLVLYIKSGEPGINQSGIIPNEEIKINDKSISFNINSFGSYQLFEEVSSTDE